MWPPLVRGAPTVMPNLQVLHLEYVKLLCFVCNNGSFDKLALEYLPSLQDVRVHLRCFDAFDDDVERQEAALKPILNSILR
jgi:hypothetical protein